MICKITILDYVWCKIEGLEPKDLQMLINKLSVYVEGYRYMPLFKLGRWDGKVRFLDRNGLMYINLIDRVLDNIDAWGYEINIVNNLPREKQYGQVDKDWFRKPNVLVDFELRPYQVEAINLALKKKNGFIIASTGSGKTSMIAGVCDYLTTQNQRCIIIVPSADLIEQTAKLFYLLGIDYGEYSGSKKDVAHQHVLSTWQALQYHPEIIEPFDCIIIDEAHGASARIVGDLLTKHGKHIPMRLGFTGTFPKPEADKMTLNGVIGNIEYQINAADLIRMGYLADLQITPIEIQEQAEEDFPDYASERAYISKQSNRLELLADLIINKNIEHGNTLVLVHSIKQGQILQKLIKNSIFLCGSDDNDVRAEWYSTFKDRDDLIVIATSGIASTGISIDRVFCLMLIDAGKSFIKCIQSIGRSLRMADDKNFAYVYDVYSSLKWGKKHSKERAKFYKEAQYPLGKVIKLK